MNIKVTHKLIQKIISIFVMKKCRRDRNQHKKTNKNDIETQFYAVKRRTIRFGHWLFSINVYVAGLLKDGMRRN